MLAVIIVVLLKIRNTNFFLWLSDCSLTVEKAGIYVIDKEKEGKGMDPKNRCKMNNFYLLET
jgi:hypothetical protein